MNSGVLVSVDVLGLYVACVHGMHSMHTAHDLNISTGSDQSSRPEIQALKSVQAKRQLLKIRTSKIFKQKSELGLSNDAWSRWQRFQHSTPTSINRIIHMQRLTIPKLCGSSAMCILMPIYLLHGATRLYTCLLSTQGVDCSILADRTHSLIAAHGDAFLRIKFLIPRSG